MEKYTSLFFFCSVFILCLGAQGNVSASVLCIFGPSPQMLLIKGTEQLSLAAPSLQGCRHTSERTTWGVFLFLTFCSFPAQLWTILGRKGQFSLPLYSSEPMGYSNIQYNFLGKSLLFHTKRIFIYLPLLDVYICNYAWASALFCMKCLAQIYGLRMVKFLGCHTLLVGNITHVYMEKDLKFLYL